MVFNLIVLVLVGAIAYFHYVQGFFSATLSAILAILAAALAVSFHEPLVLLAFRGQAADQAHALALVGLFAVIYTLLRVVFDKLVPGNLRLPLLLDKIGAAVMGAVAGVFAVGVAAIAAQTLPFGPSIAGYSRYELLEQQEVRLPTRGQSVDSYAYDLLKADTLQDTPRKSLILPVDDWVVNLVGHLSNGGSLAGPQSFRAVHPAYLDELFFQRLGVQTGARRVAYNFDGDRQVELRGLWTLDTVPQADGEIPQVRREGYPRDFPALKSDSGNIVLVARLSLSRNASDSDNNVRISPASVRLVVFNSEEGHYVNRHPVGTLDVEPAPVVRVNRPDDFLIVQGDGAVDFVFHVSRDELGLDPDPKKPLRIGQGVFIEAKRMGSVDLSGREIRRETPPPAKPTILRKKDLPQPKMLPVAAAPQARDVPLEYRQLTVSSEFFTDINVGPHDGDSAAVSFESGSAMLRENRFYRLQLEPTRSLTLLRQGDFPVRQLWTGQDQRLVQVYATPPSRASNAWEWADKLAQFELIDSNGGTYKPRGAWAKVKVGTTDMIAARYDAESQVSELPQAEGRPTDVWIAFVVPQNTRLTELRFAGKRVTSLNQQVD